jgi:hypothetical protein
VFNLPQGRGYNIKEAQTTFKEAIDTFYIEEMTSMYGIIMFSLPPNFVMPLCSGQFRD